MKLSRRSRRNPRSTFFRLWSERANSAAAISMRSERATCETTSALRRRTLPPAEETLPAWSFKVRASFGEVACQAGANPKSTPVRRESAKVNANTRRSGVAVSGSSAEFASRLRSALPVHHAKRIPMAPPASERTRLSATNWRTKRTRLAPTARRIAISFCRPTARARRRFATLAQAMSSNRPTMPSRISSGSVNCSRKSDTPLPAGHENQRLGGEPGAAALRAELHGLHLHDEQAVVVGLQAGLRLARSDARAQAAHELQPEDAPVVEAIPGGGHLGFHHGGHEGVDARAGVEAVISGRGHADHRHRVAVEQQRSDSGCRDCR